jgi:hypothetical protein
MSACGSDEPCDPEAPGTICTIAGGDEVRSVGDNGPAIDARFNEPQDVVLAPDGSLWITDFNFYNIRAIGTDGIIRRVAGTTRLGDSPEPGLTEQPCLESSFNHTPTLAFHEGYAYLAAWHNRRIKRINLATMTVENYAGTGVPEKYFGDGGPALEAAVDLPASVAIDPQGRVVFMSQSDQVIRRVNLDGTIERIVGFCIAGEQVTQCAPGQVPQQCPGSSRYTCGHLSLCDDFCWPAYGGDGGPALDARLAQGYSQSTKPGGRLLYDRADDGTLYFTDTANSCVRKIAPDGIISTVAGRCTPTQSGTPPSGGGFGGDGGPAEKARLSWPYGIELVGNKLYIADSFNHRIRVVNLP